MINLDLNDQTKLGRRLDVKLIKDFYSCVAEKGRISKNQKLIFG